MLARNATTHTAGGVGLQHDKQGTAARPASASVLCGRAATGELLLVPPRALCVAPISSEMLLATFAMSGDAGAGFFLSSEFGAIWVSGDLRLKRTGCSSDHMPSIAKGRAALQAQSGTHLPNRPNGMKQTPAGASRNCKGEALGGYEGSRRAGVRAKALRTRDFGTGAARCPAIPLSSFERYAVIPQHSPTPGMQTRS